MNLQEYIGALRRAGARIEPELHRVVQLVVVDGVEIAKGYIGHELDRWPPLAESTVATKRRLGYTGQVSGTDPLLRTHELEASITGEAVALLGQIGSTSRKMLWHEFGAHGTGRSHSGTIPPRPVIGPAMAEAAAPAALDGLFLAAAARIFEE